MSKVCMDCGTMAMLSFRKSPRCGACQDERLRFMARQRYKKNNPITSGYRDMFDSEVTRELAPLRKSILGG